MLSIIICSVSPERLEQVTRNIHDTIGVDYEIIAIDNREKQWPIARAYNEGASRAHYPFLFFVHEDVKFHSVGWGKCIEKKLKEPDCGWYWMALPCLCVRMYGLNILLMRNC